MTLGDADGRTTAHTLNGPSALFAPDPGHRWQLAASGRPPGVAAHRSGSGDGSNPGEDPGLRSPPRPRGMKAAGPELEYMREVYRHFRGLGDFRSLGKLHTVAPALLRFLRDPTVPHVPPWKKAV